ncbi:MAG: hypothetical protein OXC98_05310 [bacterium]|nr:hypothetical protein [Acidimicrobiia bacterium]MCY4649767.1 hypothetical protein [bacterium]
MANTTAKAFDQFEGKIRLTTAQRDKVTSRVRGVREFLSKSFPDSYDIPLRKATLMGSAARGTIIRPLDDIDVLATFYNKNDVFEKYRNDSQSFIYRLRERINAETAVQQVGTRGQAVRLFYKDGLHVDIAPVFAWNSGGYALPSGTGKWITTDPPAQEKWVKERESTLNRQFQRTVRLLKRWNSVHSSRLGSWHLEVMVGRIFTSISSNHREVLMRFFEWAPGHLNVQDPDGHGGDLGASLTGTQQSNIKNSFNSSHTRATKAVNAETKGNHAEAIRLWKIILGSEFPSHS